jgi:hypothetical protein
MESPGFWKRGKEGKEKKRKEERMGELPPLSRDKLTASMVLHTFTGKYTWTNFG